ncbi:Wzz/FepE/Etk N-terminal domain-containing protein [Bacillus cereus group sp. RP43]|uniref:YveK family protein n=1 Tax=Bacillus cereus group sp. RP43 TaxID=3040260 RepID=UPI003390D830
MEKITFNDFWKVCKKHFLIISMLPITVITIVYLLNKEILPPKFETATQLIVSMPKSNVEGYYFDNVRSSMQLVDTFSSIVQSKKVMEEVNKQLHIKNNSNKVTVITDEKSLIINVKVTGENNKEIIDVANAVAGNAQEKFKQLFEGMNIKVLSKSEEAKEISITFQLILGTITGIMSSLIFIFTILFFSSIITKNEQIKQMGYIVLGDVPLTNGREEDIYV